jgi:hypothetical protein
MFWGIAVPTYHPCEISRELGNAIPLLRDYQNSREKFLRSFIHLDGRPTVTSKYSMEEKFGICYVQIIVEQVEAVV